MSSVTSASSSPDISYAMQLAQSSALNRSLFNLGNAVQNGDMTSANSILTAFIKANPQYATTSSDGSQSSSPINQDFQTLATAISNNRPDAARGAWTQVRSDLSKAGLANLSNGTDATAQLLAQSKASVSQQILSDTFGAAGAAGATSGGPSISTLLSGGSSSSGDVGLPASLINSWITYQNGGNAVPSAASASVGNLLNTSA